MKIGLIAVDSNHPNLALMKLSAFHKNKGNQVDWYNPLDGEYDIVFMSKIFKFTADWMYPINAHRVVMGGTGYDNPCKLPEEAEYITPNYSIYPNIPNDTAYGFLTRGCPNHCKWCIVPKIEGDVHPYMDIEQVAGGRKKAILMDNNILASEYGLQQIEKIIKLGIRVDFNQALDARLVTNDIAKLLARVKWIRRIRFGCDTPSQIQSCENAINLIQRYGYKGEFFLYCMLIGDIEECYNRVSFFRNTCKNVTPFCQPFRDVNNHRHIIPQWQKDMARWANRKEIYRVTDFKEYIPRKGFICSEYFK